MKPRRLCLLAALLAAAACQPKGTVVTPRAKPSPSAHHPASASASVAADQPLAPPADGGVPITGTLRVDQGYATAAGGKIVSNNGAAAVTLGAGIVSNNSGNIISDNGLGLISDNGLGLISDNGLGLIGKVKLISDNGLGLVANNGAGRRLLEAASGSLPAAGMLVGAVSLTDGQPVAIGRDAAGKPAYAAYTNAAGAFTLYLPKGLAGNVRLVARPLGLDDPRLEYGLVVKGAEAHDLKLEDASSQAAAYLRVVLVGRLDDLIRTNINGDIPENALGHIPDAIQGAVTGVINDFRQASIDAKLVELPDDQRRGVLLATADVIASTVDLDASVSDYKNYKLPGTPPPAMAELTDVLARMEERTAALLAKDPKFFEGRPYLVEINRARAAAGRPLFHIVAPGDVGAMVVREFLSSNTGPQIRKMDTVLQDLGLGKQDRLRFQAAAGGVNQALAYQLLVGEGVLARAKAAMRDAATAARALPPQASPTPMPGDVPPSPAPTAEPVQVTTVAGGAAPGDADGPGEAAGFNLPKGLVVDPAAPQTTLYVAEAGAHRIRMVVVDADGHATVSTLAGKGKAGYRDGDGTQAKFSAPHALALGPDHKLYVADADNQRIRVVDLVDPAHPVSTLAGSTKGFANGPAASAQFASPGALAFDAHGDLLVGEIESFTIRKIAMADPAHPVTTAAGTGEWMDDDGPADQATMGHVTGLAAGPGGLMAFSDYSNGLVRLLRPDNQIAILAGSWLGGFREALWRSAGLHGPYGLAVDPGGTVYLAEGDDHRIWRITSLGDAAVLAGGGPAGNKQPEIPGAFADGPGPEARFNHPTGIAVDARGDLYVADAQNHRIRRIRRGS